MMTTDGPVEDMKVVSVSKDGTPAESFDLQVPMVFRFDSSVFNGSLKDEIDLMRGKFINSTERTERGRAQRPIAQGNWRRMYGLFEKILIESAGAVPTTEI
eukprot:692837-Prorocentrum_lima.AAC.1